MYEIERRKPTAAQAFLMEVAEVTRRTPNSVKLWVQGFRHPDDLAKEAIGRHFNVDPEFLFPDVGYNHPEIDRKKNKPNNKPMKEAEEQ